MADASAWNEGWNSAAHAPERNRCMCHPDFPCPHKAQAQEPAMSGTPLAKSFPDPTVPLWHGTVGWYIAAPHHPDIGYYMPVPAPSMPINPRFNGSSDPRTAFGGATKRKRLADDAGDDISSTMPHVPGSTSKPPASSKKRKLSSLAFPCTCQDQYVPKRPANAWIIYRSYNGAKAKEHLSKRGQSSANPEVSRLLSQWWKEESPAVKKKYEKLAEERKAEHDRLNPGYKYNPNLRRNKKYGMVGGCVCGAREKNQLFREGRRELGLTTVDAVGYAEKEYKKMHPMKKPKSPRLRSLDTTSPSRSNKRSSPFAASFPAPYSLRPRGTVPGLAPLQTSVEPSAVTTPLGSKDSARPGSSRSVRTDLDFDFNSYCVDLDAEDQHLAAKRPPTPRTPKSSGSKALNIAIRKSPRTSKTKSPSKFSFLQDASQLPIPDNLPYNTDQIMGLDSNDVSGLGMPDEDWAQLEQWMIDNPDALNDPSLYTFTDGTDMVPDAVNMEFQAAEPSGYSPRKMKVSRAPKVYRRLGAFREERRSPRMHSR